MNFFGQLFRNHFDSSQRPASETTELYYQRHCRSCAAPASERCAPCSCLCYWRYGMLGNRVRWCFCYPGGDISSNRINPGVDISRNRSITNTGLIQVRQNFGNDRFDRYSVAIDSDDYLLVADSGNHRILRFRAGDADGEVEAVGREPPWDIRTLRRSR